ncbi:hypothetical protein ACX3PB_005569, partial [Escherichia coli]
MVNPPVRWGDTINFHVADWYHEQSVHREAPDTMLHNTPLHYTRPSSEGGSLQDMNMRRGIIHCEY